MTCAKVLASLAMLAGVLSFVPLQAETFVQDGATFEYTVANDEVTITAVTVAAGRLAFPSEIGGLPVRTIAENAVKGNVNIQDVFAPNSVSNLGASAFAGCSALTNMVLPFVGSQRNNYNASSAVFGYVFGTSSYSGAKSVAQNYGTYYIPTSLVHVAITDETRLGSGCFWNCTMLREVNLPDTITNRAYGSFSGCSNLKSLAIPYLGNKDTEGFGTWFYTSTRSYTSQASCVPASLKEVRLGKFSEANVGAFYGMTALESVSLSGPATNLPSQFFYGCSSLTNVELNSGLVKIGERAFYNCTNLVDLELPDSLAVIDRQAFEGCSRMVGYGIPSSVSSIGVAAFRGNAALTSFSVPESLETLNAFVLGGCTNLGSVMVGNVTRINACAFSNCYSLVEIALPGSVTNIETYAFYDCTNLTSLTIPVSVESIGLGAFSGCSGLREITLPFVGERRGNLTNSHFGYIFGNRPYQGGTAVNQYYGSSTYSTYCIPSSLTAVKVTEENMLGFGAFSYISWLEEIELPESLVSIGERAFYNCAKLQELKIPSAVTRIPERFCEGCSALKNMSFPESVVSIETAAFYNCISLTNVSSLVGLEKVGNSAFYNCRSLSMGALPSSVTNIGTQAFYGTAAVTEVSIPQGMEKVPANQYQGMGGVKRIVIPEGVTDIGMQAFANCTNLVEIQFPSTLTNIDANAFQQCTALGDIVVPENVLQIGSGAFAGCSSLTNIVLPFVGRRRGNSGSAESLWGYVFGSASYDGMKQISQYAYNWDGSSYRSYFYVPKGRLHVLITDETVLSYGSFGNCDMLETLELNGTIRTLPEYSLGNCTSLKRLLLPPSLETVRSYALLNCSQLTELEFPDGITSIAEYALRGCAGLEKLTIPFVGSKRGNSGDRDSLFGWLFGQSSFTGSQYVYQRYSPTSGTEYYMPTSLVEVVVTGETSLGFGAFDKCSGIEAITVNSVSNIAPAAFRGCSALKAFEIPTLVTSVASNTFENCQALATVVFPTGMTNINTCAFLNCSSLQAAELPEGVVSVGRKAFSGCCSLEKLYLPSTLENIAEDAFFCCESMRDVRLPDGLQTVAGNLFRGCYGIENLTLGAGVTNIQANAFADCSNLVAVTIPVGVETIELGAFANCVAIKTLSLPPTVKGIGESAFSGCLSLKDLIVPDSVLTIGRQAFTNCSSLKSLSLSDSLLDIGPFAFAGCSALTALTIPDSVTNVAESAFNGCVSMLNPEIGLGVKALQANAFKDCRSIDNIVVPTNVLYMGSGVFAGCSSVTNLVIPFVGSSREASGTQDAVLGWLFGTDEFRNSYSANQSYKFLPGVERYYSNSLYYDTTYLTYYGTTFYYYPQRFTTNIYWVPNYLRTVSVTDGRWIATGAFSECMSLTSISLNEGIDKIGQRAFYNCWRLVSTEIPSTVGLIEGAVTDYYNYTTEGDTSALPHQVLDARPFGGMSSIRSLKMPSGLITMANLVSSYQLLTNVELTANSEQIRKEEFKDCVSLAMVRVPAGVKTVGATAFYGCTALTNVTYEGDAPRVDGMDIYDGTPESLVSYVSEGSLGWDGYPSSTALPALGTWPVSLTGARKIAFAGKSESGEPTPPNPEGEISGTKIEVSGDTDAAVVVEGMTGAQVHGLPAGMTWDAETGTLGGLAAEPGTYELFLVKDGKVQRYALTVAAPSAPRARYELTAGVATNLVVGGVTGCDAYALPDGLAWDKVTATLSGAARAAGTNTVYFVRGYGDDTQFFSTVLCVAAGTAADGPGNVTPGGPSEGPGDVPGTPGTPPEQEHPGVVDPGTVPEEKTSFAVLASVQLEGEARGTAKVSTESVPRGESVKLTARAANGKTLFAYWQEKGGGIVGYAANLTVTPTRDSEYVAVFRAKSVCAEPAFDGDGFASVATNAMVGVQFRTRIPVDPAAYPVRFTGSRLPNGLTIDAATGEIKGVPVKAGTFVATVKAVSRANVSKRATVQLAITVIPLPDWAQGTFEGALEGDGEDGDLRGVAHATVSSRGRISGKLMERGTNFVFTVNGYDASSRFTDGVTNLVVSATAKAGKVTQAFAATMLDAGLAGRLGDSDVWLARSPWKDAEMAAKLAPFVGLYTVQFVSDGSAGHGYLSLMVDKAGRVKATGKLADGTAVSTTLPLLWDDAAEAPYVVFFVAPTAYAGGYAYETIRFDAQKRIRGEGGLWLNLAPTATADYGEGFGCSFASRGAWYNTLAALRDSYGTLAFKADAPDLATPVKVTDEDENGKSATTTVTEWQAAVDLDCWNTLTVALDAKGTGFAVAKTTKPVQDKTTKAWIYAGENDAGLSLAFKQATGIFSGSFTCWYDYVSARDYLKDTETLAHTSKTVKFEGISVQGDPALRGFGLWEATGSYEDEKTGKEKTYKVVESYPVVFE